LAAEEVLHCFGSLLKSILIWRGPPRQPGPQQAGAGQHLLRPFHAVLDIWLPSFVIFFSPYTCPGVLPPYGKQHFQVLNSCLLKTCWGFPNSSETW
jgi:hypothetical protein